MSLDKRAELAEARVAELRAQLAEQQKAAERWYAQALATSEVLGAVGYIADQRTASPDQDLNEIAKRVYQWRSETYQRVQSASVQ